MALTPEQREARDTARMAERVTRWDQLRKWPKAELVAEISRRRRVHGCDIRTPKQDLVAFLVDLELPVAR